MYKTIRAKVYDEARRSTNPKCACGQLMHPKDVNYYINEFGERVPICIKCLLVVHKNLTLEEFDLFFRGVC